MIIETGTLFSILNFPRKPTTTRNVRMSLYYLLFCLHTVAMAQVSKEFGFIVKPAINLQPLFEERSDGW